MNINFLVIPHNEQRYPTCGDWWWEGDTLQIRVSDMGNPYYAWFVGAHEIDEALLCQKHGIMGKQIDEFDSAFERLRERYPELIGDQEPGNMSSAPYHREHEAATLMEMQRCEEFEEDWEQYDKKVNSL